MRKLRETLVDQAIPAMLSFRPRIGKINVQRGGGICRQQIFQKICRLYSHAAKIHQPISPPFAIQFADASEQTLDAQEIPFGMLLRVIDEERSIAAAKLHLQWLRFWEKRARFNPFNDGRQFINQIERRTRKHVASYKRFAARTQISS